MKKIILPLAFAAFIGMTMNAQTNNSVKNAENGCCQKQEQCCKTDGKKCEKEAKKEGHKKGDMRHGGKERFNPFQGIELTADQQTQLQNLREERKLADRKKSEDRKAEKAEQKKQYNEKVKSILTPEQYAQYEKNMAQKADRKSHHKGAGHRHHGGDRSQRGSAPQK
ncbi:MAG: DUF1682 domain-containing protein [Muribaculaceae bacterium]|nr:DUF1682 domain-containing protein [Muribaculaceae bacterium]